MRRDPLGRGDACNSNLTLGAQRRYSEDAPPEFVFGPSPGHPLFGTRRGHSSSRMLNM